MRSLIIVLAAPLFKDDLRFEQAAEEFAVEALTAQLVVEALDVAVLPRAARLDVECLDLRACRRLAAARARVAPPLGPRPPVRQYASDAYRELLRRPGVVASMSRPANCDDNARMERFWATLKTELIDGQVYATRAQAGSAIFWSIEVFYNRARLHGALGYHSPVDYEHNLY